VASEVPVDAEVMAETTVNGEDAVVTLENFDAPVCLLWGDGTAGLALCTSDGASAPLDLETLVTVAESVPELG
jgi:hypothetical protein